MTREINVKIDVINQEVVEISEPNYLYFNDTNQINVKLTNKDEDDYYITMSTFLQDHTATVASLTYNSETDRYEITDLDMFLQFPGQIKIEFHITNANTDKITVIPFVIYAEMPSDVFNNAKMNMTDTANLADLQVALDLLQTLNVEDIEQAAEILQNLDVEQIEALSSELQALINAVEYDLKNGKFDGKDGTDGRDGVDGFSPTCTFTAITNGYKLEITDINGTKSINILNGIDGKNGVDGKSGSDGFSPIAAVEQTESGATITIQDKTQTTTATITNGKDGIDGKNGSDGRDYVLTEADKQEIAEEAAALVPAGNSNYQIIDLYSQLSTIEAYDGLKVFVKIDDRFTSAATETSTACTLNFTQTIKEIDIPDLTINCGDTLANLFPKNNATLQAYLNKYFKTYSGYHVKNQWGSEVYDYYSTSAQGDWYYVELDSYVINENYDDTYDNKTFVYYNGKWNLDQYDDTEVKTEINGLSSEINDINTEIGDIGSVLDSINGEVI